MSSTIPPFNPGIPLVKGLFFVCFFLCLTYGNALAQCDNFMTPPMGPPQARACKPYSLTLTLGGPGVQGNEAVTWAVAVAGPGLPMGTLADIGLALTPAGTSATITGVPTIAGSFNLHIVVTCNAANCFNCGAGAECSGCASAITRDMTLVVNSVRAPVDVALVLDISGSMLQSIPGYTLNKWGVLKESVQAFLEDYKNWGECDDRIAVTYFDNQRLNFRTGGLLFFNKAPDGPIPLTGANSILEDMNSKSPGTTTCMGGGILAGYSAFDAPMPPRRRYMILFTDGIQNMEPTVSQAAGTNMVINDYNIRGDGTGFPAPPLDLKAPPRSFRTFAVGIGDDAVTSLLGEITQAPTDPAFDGDMFPINSTVDLVTTLSNAFTQSFVETFSQFSPQLIDIRRINVAYPVSTKFVVNPSADRLLIRIVANPGLLPEARIRIEKDDRDLSSLLRTGGQTYRSFFIDTTLVKRYEVSLDGEWKVSINGPRGSYQVTCMINDEELEASANLGNVQYAPGDTMRLEATLQFADQPVKNANRAAVWIARPGQDVNDLFAAAASVDPPSDFPGEKGNDPGQAKYEALIALDPVFAKALQPINDSINLTNEANGKYSARFSSTAESGIYRFVFRLAGNDPATGAYERFILRSTVVDFGLADESKSVFQILVRDGLSYFQIIPKNKFDHLLGPNRLNQVQLLVAGKQIMLTDKLDGSYEAVVPDFPFLKPDPKIEVGIKGDSFFKGHYSGIEGNGLTFWDKYRPWIILLILLILLLIFLLRRKTTTP